MMWKGMIEEVKDARRFKDYVFAHYLTWNELLGWKKSKKKSKQWKKQQKCDVVANVRKIEDTQGRHGTT